MPFCEVLRPGTIRSGEIAPVKPGFQVAITPRCSAWCRSAHIYTSLLCNGNDQECGYLLSSGALARDVRAITTLLNDYLRETDVDISDTMAAMEYREEPTFADDQVINPVTHVQLQAHHSLVAAIDHLGGVAACIAAENITLAPISLMRPIVVASGVSYWLLDPDITLRERLRRGWNLELTRSGSS